MRPVLISLVITTYNRAALLTKALESVAASQIKDPEDVEVIVVDNNSTDDTRRTVEEIKARGFPFVLRYVFERNQGLSYARNRGAEEAGGRYVAFMDDDELIEKHYLSRIGSAFADTGAVCVGGPYIYYDKGVLPNWLPPLLAVCVEERRYGDKRRIIDAEGEKLLGGNMVFNRQELIDIGRFNVNLGRTGNVLLGGEEDELQDRLRLAKKKVAYDPQLIQYHRLDPARLTKRFWHRHQFDRGRTLWRLKSLEGDMGAYSTFLGAPRWLWRYLLTKDIPRAVWPLLKLDMTQYFYRRLDVCNRLGQIHEARQQSRIKPNVIM